MTNQILPQSVTPRNGHGLQVRLTCPMRTLSDGLIIPTGTIGKVIEYNHHINKLMIDFGIANYVHPIDPRSDVIEFVR